MPEDVQNKQSLSRTRKGILILATSAVLTYFTAGFFGSIEGKFFDFGGTWIGTIEAWQYLFGLFIAPTFFLPLLIFLFVDKAEKGLYKFLMAILILIILINLATGLASIIFSVIFIALGYALAKFIRWLISSRAKA